MKLTAILLALLTPACFGRELPVDPDIACDEQASAWCFRAFVTAYPTIPVADAFAQAELATCHSTYVEECLTGEPMLEAELNACLDDIQVNEVWTCVPLSCAASWATGLGKDEPSHWCQI